MGIAAAAAVVGAGAAVAGTVYSIANSPSGGSSSPNATQGGNPATYIPTDQPQADQYYQGIFQQMQPYASALPGETIPGYQTYAANIQANPYAAQAQTGANTAAQYGTTAAGYGMQGAGQLQGAAGQVLQTGFDPQQAFYNQSIGNLQNQYGYANAASGVSGPAAAGVTDQGLNNFNLGWQNQQLAQQTSALGAAGQGFAGAQTLGDLASTTQAAATQLPYSTYLGQQTNDISALGSLTSGTNAAFGANESLANLLQSYLGLGQSATGLAQQGEAANFGQQSSLGSSLGQTISGLGTSLSNLYSNSNSASSLPSYTSNPTGLESGYSGSNYDLSAFDPSTDFGDFGY